MLAAGDEVAAAMGGAGWFCCGARTKDAAGLPGDYYVVAKLMRALSAHLPEHWEKERASQRQRQLVLAVNRNDAEACAALLAAGADPNLRLELHLAPAPPYTSVTPLYLAAESRRKCTWPFHAVI